MPPIPHPGASSGYAKCPAHALSHVTAASPRRYPALAGMQKRAPEPLCGPALGWRSHQPGCLPTAWTSASAGDRPVLQGRSGAPDPL